MKDADWWVRVTTGSRLSFMMLDMNGHGGRRNGVASVYLERPRFRASFRPADAWRIGGDGPLADEHARAIVDLLERLRDAWDGPHVELLVHEAIPHHRGFGSKTTTLMGVAKAYEALCGRRSPTEELARVAGRGGTGGASVNLIDRGGFVVDGGHRNPDDFAADPHRYLRPSAAARPGRIPPALIRMPFPAWPILVIVPHGSGLHGPEEVRWFTSVTPIPEGDAHQTVHAALMRLAPAIAEQDYESFCRAVNWITARSRFKREQIAVAPESTRTVLAEALANGVDAIGMSSMGPMCYAFTRRPGPVRAWIDELRERALIRDCWFTNARNVPATVEWVAPAAAGT